MFPYFSIFLISLLNLAPSADDPPKTLELQTAYIPNGLQWKVGKHKIVYAIQLNANLNAQGTDRGKLHIDPNKLAISEFGDYLPTSEIPRLSLDVTISFIKKGVVQVAESRRVAAPLVEVKWALYEIKSPDFKNKVTLALREGERWHNGRLMIHDDKGTVYQVIHIADPGPPEPCHPGCFPAGTRIETPGGTRLIESLKAGETVTTLSLDGKLIESTIASVFVTKNRLLELRTTHGILITTETQPLCLANGALRAAGELVAGDEIGLWHDGRKQFTRVRAVEPTPRNETVYNLVLGEPVLFIANGFFARSKPPSVAK